MRLYSYTNTLTLLTPTTPVCECGFIPIQIHRHYLTPTTPPCVCTRTTMAYVRAVTPKHMPRIVALQTQHTDTLMPEAEDERGKDRMTPTVLIKNAFVFKTLLEQRSLLH